VGDVMCMMRSFQRMLEALINLLDHDDGRGFEPIDGSQRPPVVSGSVHRELKKVKFLEFWGSTEGLAAKSWLENMTMCYALHDYTSNMKVCIAVF